MYKCKLYVGAVRGPPIDAEQGDLERVGKRQYILKVFCQNLRRQVSVFV